MNYSIFYHGFKSYLLQIKTSIIIRLNSTLLSWSSYNEFKHFKVLLILLIYSYSINYSATLNLELNIMCFTRFNGLNIFNTKIISIIIN